MNHRFNRRALVRGLVLALAVSGGSFAFATDVAPPAAVAVAGAHSQVGVYRGTVGDFKVTALSDGTVALDIHPLMKGVTTAEVDAALRRSFQANPVETSINAYLIDTGSRLVLIDTGVGEFFGPGKGGKLVTSLAAAGVRPDQIDDILLTHIHSDHSGGMIHAGKAVFPRATVHVGKPDVDFFLAPANQNGANGYDKAYFQQGSQTIAPYQASGRLNPFSGRTEVLPGITAIPAPGHTPGHVVYRVESKGESMTFIGDLVHVEAVQMAQPGITVAFDVDQKTAATQRLASFAEFAKEGEAIAAAHLPFPGIGHLAKTGAGYTFVPEVYRDRD
ncbi:MAG: MBL fold metallo-hydrolase [Luteibacter sp.]